ncbi:ketopantoate reductase family protein [Pelagovum pacificum]|uniref:2-dehydropantoate 2-reductase n=1 Tax=Pelagovum pacificum TaxID=2588711 RepID=A0A5C5GA93_9RHOB|nr:2-dehydropantoate 2-reductase N-terminal domain-containing protein [Pelagovum pacificum]QQA41612.1 ketopantoate reductase family protein [Pelagovum pacificum]TNY30892.1 ketopantoate reductase family protein [Pelagovum pacificum]
MRIIVHGVGAVGGTIAAGLALSGQEVVGIARGRQLEAIRANGLRLRSPDEDVVARFDCVGDPSEIDLRPDDAVILTTKTQDTAGALAQLRAAGLTDQPLFCAQNGVENERLALRLFPNVHGITVMLPADYITPGEVSCFGTPRHGIFDIGRFPGGHDADDEAMAEALTASGIGGFVRDDVMRYKYGKLILNLGNVIDAALGSGEETNPILDMLRAEGAAVFEAAGIDPVDVGAADPRRDELMQLRDVEGVERTGSSSRQSLARGAGSIETDYLNGEVVLLGRMHGVPTPGNDWALALGRRLLREGIAPGALDVDAVKAELGL